MAENERSKNKRLRRTQKREEKKQMKYSEYDDFNAIFTYEHLWQSTKQCMKGVSWKASVQKVSISKTFVVSLLYHALMDGKFRISEISEFTLRERGKIRHIRSVGIKERIVQRCLCDFSLVPMIVPSLIYDNGASMKGKGVDFTRKRLHQHLESFKKKYQDGYVVVFDFQKYFESIPHELILKCLKEHYTDQRIVDLVMMFVRCSNPNGIGIDIGSQVSQVLALAAASPLDHYIKETLRCKHYARYMDDGYILCHSKEEADMIKRLIEDFVTNKMHMKLSAKKTKVVKLSKGFTFLKNRYRVIGGKTIITPCKKTVTVMRRKLKKFVFKMQNGQMTYEDVYTSYQSWRSHLKWSKCYWIIKRMDDLFDSLFYEPCQYDYDRWEMYHYLDEYRADKIADKEMVNLEQEEHNALVQKRKDFEKEQREKYVIFPMLLEQKLLNDKLERQRFREELKERNRIWYERNKSNTALIESMAWVDELEEDLSESSYSSILQFTG